MNMLLFLVKTHFLITFIQNQHIWALIEILLKKSRTNELNYVLLTIRSYIVIISIVNLPINVENSNKQKSNSKNVLYIFFLIVLNMMCGMS